MFIYDQKKSGYNGRIDLFYLMGLILIRSMGLVFEVLIVLFSIYFSGIAYLLKVLGQNAAFDSLHWWSGVRRRYIKEREKVILVPIC